MTQPRLISCDEAGNTGPNLSDADQPVFVYAALDLSADEAIQLVASVRSKYCVQSAEPKSTLLRKRANWPEIALEIMSRSEGRVIVIVFDKRLCLGGKTYEYFIEPDLQENKALFCRHNLHRFIMNELHSITRLDQVPVHELALEIEAFLRSFDPLKAPALFATTNRPGDGPIVVDCLLRFSRGYSAAIAERTAHLRAEESNVGKWVLDLTSSALFSLTFRGWGHQYRENCHSITLRLMLLQSIDLLGC
jgi:hypothetical protein